MSNSEQSANAPAEEQPTTHVEMEDKKMSSNDKCGDQKRQKERVRSQLSVDERRYLLSVQKGDIKATRRMIELGAVDKNCTDPMGRSALTLAIINEDLQMVRLLLSLGVDAQDALLHAIVEEFVEAAELLLMHEDSITALGRQHSWEGLPLESRNFSSDITPLILAAQLDRFEIVKLLLDRGATLPLPHDVRCGCDDCVTSRTKDSVHHSRSRMNTFRALASPSLICLTAKDPIYSTFQLSWELRRLSDIEHEFKNEYKELKRKCKMFATALLDHTRSSNELEIILNYDPMDPVMKVDGRMTLRRLKLAIKLHQKEFVTHPNVQQLLVAIWYEGLPGFRRKSACFQLFETLKIAFSFPLLSLVYMLAPYSAQGRRLKKPFIKFICHSASYITFLFLLIWVSLSKETTGMDSKETTGMDSKENSRKIQKAEYLIFLWLCGMFKLEMKRMLAEENLQEYLKDMWKLMDLGTSILYVIVIVLRVLELCGIGMTPPKEMEKSVVCREYNVDVRVLSECLLSAANIFSCLRMVYIFSVSPYLGPMQVSLSRMVTDMVRFFLLFLLVLFAFSCGLIQLLRVDAANERRLCCEPTSNPDYNWRFNLSLTDDLGLARYSNESCINSLVSTENATCFRDASGSLLNCSTDVTNNSSFCFMNVSNKEDPNCDVRLRFSTLLETMQTMFWTVFGVIDMNQFNLKSIEGFTRFSAKFILGTYSIIMNVVLLNLLIAMLNNSYQLIAGKEDVEWKFARSKLWISYFDEKCTLPPPFNIFPTSKFLLRVWNFFRKMCRCCRCGQPSPSEVKCEEPDETRRELLKEQEASYEKVMRHLVRRYILTTQQGIERGPVCEDDINELKQDISALRCELIDVLQQTGYKVSAYCNAGLGGRKTRQRERRMMKDFDVVPSQDSIVGLWPGKNPQMKKILLSATAPIISTATRRASGVGTGAMAVLKQKRKTLFGIHKREPVRSFSVPTRSQNVQPRSFERAQSDKDTYNMQDAMSPSTTNESVTTYSSDTFDATTITSNEELVPPIASKDNM